MKLYIIHVNANLNVWGTFLYEYTSVYLDHLELVEEQTTGASYDKESHVVLT